MVANGWAGFGVPLTVTVGTSGTGEGGVEVGEAFGARMVKRCDVACIIPCVEFRKMRK